MVRIATFKGFNMPKPWDAKAFMGEVRAKIPSHQAAPIKLKDYGTSLLTGGEGTNIPISGTFEFVPGNQYQIGVSHVDFMLVRHHDEGMREQFPFILQPAFRSLYLGFSKDSAKVIGTASEDSRVLRSSYTEGFPEYAFALTYLGVNMFQLDAIEANPLSLNIKVGARTIDKATMNEIITQNAVKIRQLLNSPMDLKNLLFGRYLFAVADPQGMLLNFMPKSAMKVRGVTGLAIKFYWSEGVHIKLEGCEELEPIYLEGMPDYIKTMMEMSATRARSIDLGAEALNRDLKISRKYPA